MGSHRCHDTSRVARTPIEVPTSLLTEGQWDPTAPCFWAPCAWGRSPPPTDDYSWKNLPRSHRELESLSPVSPPPRGPSGTNVMMPGSMGSSGTFQEAELLVWPCPPPHAHLPPLAPGAPVGYTPPPDTVGLAASASAPGDVPWAAHSLEASPLITPHPPLHPQPHGHA